MKHLMMLSDLYGRIGQMLKEHGDAPIGKVQSSMFPNESYTTADCIKPIYCSFHLTTTEIGKIKIKTYEPVMEE
jgi:hypothetical protein